MNQPTATVMPHGRYFEEFQVGETVVTPARTITEADVVNFAGLSGDWTQIHVDAEYVKSHPFGQRVAHGMLILSVASALLVRTGLLEGTVIAFREIGSWKFSRPVFLGDTVHVEAHVTETKPISRLKGGSLTLELDVVNQMGKVVQHGIWNVLVMSRIQEDQAQA